MKKIKIITFLIVLVGVSYVAYFFVDNVVLSRKILPLSTAQFGSGLQKAPDFQLQDLRGRLFSMSSFQDKIVIVHFWASWCPPCVREFPELLRLIEHFQGRVVVIALSNDGSVADVRNFVEKLKWKNPYLYVAGDFDYRLAGLYGVRKLPESFIFSKNLNFQIKVAGFREWMSPFSISEIEKLINQ